MGVQPLACWNCGFESSQGHGSLSVVRVASYQAEVSALGWSLIQRSRTACGVPECDREALIMRAPGQTMAVCTTYTSSNLFAHSSLLQPQGNGSFYADSHPPITLWQREREREEVGGAGLYYTIKDLWQALRNISLNKYYWRSDSMYVTLCQTYYFMFPFLQYLFLVLNNV